MVYQVTAANLTNSLPTTNNHGTIVNCESEPPTGNMRWASICNDPSLTNNLPATDAKVRSSWNHHNQFQYKLQMKSEVFSTIPLWANPRSLMLGLKVLAINARFLWKFYSLWNVFTVYCSNCTLHIARDCRCTPAWFRTFLCKTANGHSHL